MSRHLLRLIAIAFAISCIHSALRAADFPQWRGTNRDGKSAETGLLPQWPAEGPRLLWQRNDIGSGYSTPSIVGNRIYVISNEGIENESVKALDAKDGSEVWSKRIGKVGKPDQQPPYPGSRSTPTVEDGVLYALGSDGDLACLELAGGKIRWQKNLQTDFGGKPGIWAYSESPLVDGDLVVASPGGNEATLVALNKKTGEVAWKCPVPEGDDAGYASIVIAGAGDKKQYVQLLGKKLVGVEAKTGKFLWQYLQLAERSMPNIPTPVVDGPYVYAVPMRSGGVLMKLNLESTGGDAEKVYFNPKTPKAIGGSVKLGQYLYGTSDAATCVDFLTGEEKWTQRGIGAASVLYADGNLYLHGENGDAALIEATPEAYRERGRFTLPGQPERARGVRAWAYPAIAGGRLYFRDQNVLWCYDISASQAAE